MNYLEANNYLGKKTDRPIGNNTRLVRIDSKTIGVKLHQTIVVKIFKNDSVELNSGGWFTPTTKDRINCYSPAQVRQEKSVWYVAGSEFYDGIRLNKSGKVISKVLKTDPSIQKRLNKAIKSLVNGMIDDIKTRGFSPDGGDCWCCSMFSGDDIDHVLSHLREQYVSNHSFVIHAARKCGYRDAYIGLALHDLKDRQDASMLKRIFQSYFKKNKSKLLKGWE